MHRFRKIFLLALFCVGMSATAGEFSGQVAVIVGASQGIGESIARELAEQGADTVLLARNEKKLLALATDLNSNSEGKVSYHVVDITNHDEFNKTAKKIVEKYGKVDVVVQNVGIYPRKQLLGMDVDFLNNILNVNVVSAINAVQQFLPKMVESNYGRIVMVSSITGPRTGIPGLSAYGASKGALSGFIKTAAIELAPYNITINSVEPGYIMTEGLEHLGEDYFSSVKKSVPLDRMGEGREIAKVVAFLASHGSSYVTGVGLVADGGLTLPESHYLHVPKRT